MRPKHALYRQSFTQNMNAAGLEPARPWLKATLLVPLCIRVRLDTPGWNRTTKKTDLESAARTHRRADVMKWLPPVLTSGTR